jgi:hypothetical protein
MYQSDTELLFPIRIAESLRQLRGPTWASLVDEVCQSPEASLKRLAFSLLLIRMSSCLTCHTHSYRALRGCTFCATQSVRRFRGEDDELVEMFEAARSEIQVYLEAMQETLLLSQEA